MLFGSNVRDGFRKMFEFFIRIVEQRWGVGVVGVKQIPGTPPWTSLRPRRKKCGR
jgi:hypothetical protein